MCPYFYVCTKQFTALFTAPGVRGSGDFTAVLSQSTTTIRQTLLDDEVPFEMPLAPTFFEDRAKFKAAQLEYEQLQTHLGVNLQTTSKRQIIDFKPQSMLSFDGHDGVAGLYEFLLNRTFARKSAIPTIHAATSFENAVLKSIKVAFSGPVKRSHSRRRSSQMEEVHALELQGTILPHSFLRLNEVLAKTQGGQFDAVLEKSDHAKPTVALNCALGGKAAAGGAPAPTEQDDPVLAQLQKPPTLGCKMMVRLRSADGAFQTALTKSQG